MAEKLPAPLQTLPPLLRPQPRTAFVTAEIASLKHETDGKDGEIASLKAEADTKDAEIGSLKASANTKDAEIAQLKESGACG